MTRRARGRAARVAAAAVLVPVLLPFTAPGPAVAAPGDQCDPAVTQYNAETPEGLLQLGARAANTVATGRGVVVAVVDSGVDVGNAHFPAGTVLPGTSVVAGTPPTGQVDAYGHGTAIAGQIAARAVPGSGVVGLAPEATILPIRVFVSEEDNGTPGSSGPSVGSMAAGILTAAQQGAKIINVSLSTTVNDPGLQGAVAFATAQGALVVASAGNRNTTDDTTDSPRYPGAYPDVLSVAAVDGSGFVTDDSIHGSYVDVAAPGTNILTAFRAAGDCTLSAEEASTSYATAYVSAAAALVAQAHPDETPAQWRYRLEATALRSQPDQRNDDSGWGSIQPYEALTFDFDGGQPGPANPAVSAPATDAVGVDRIDPVAAATVDTTARDQTMWVGLGAVVAVLALALVALLRRDRKKALRPASRPPAGVR